MSISPSIMPTFTGGGQGLLAPTYTPPVAAPVAQTPSTPEFAFNKGQSLTSDQVNSVLQNRLKTENYGLVSAAPYDSLAGYTTARDKSAATALDRNDGGFDNFSQRLKVPVKNKDGSVSQYSFDPDGNGGWTVAEGGDGGWKWDTERSWYDAEKEEQRLSGFDRLMETVIPSVIGYAVGGPALGGTLGATTGAAIGSAAANTFAHGGNLTNFIKNAATAWVGGQIASYINPTLVGAGQGALAPNALQATLGPTGSAMVANGAAGLITSGGKFDAALAGSIGAGVNTSIGGGFAGNAAGTFANQLVRSQLTKSPTTSSATQATPGAATTTQARTIHPSITPIVFANWAGD